MNASSKNHADILALYGEAMLQVQHFEEALVGLLGVRREIEAAAVDEITDAIESMDAWSALFTLPAGRVAQCLALPGKLGDRIRRGIEARNLLAHHYLRDWESRLDIPMHRQQTIEDLQRASENFRSLAAAVETERFEMMHNADLTDDELTTPEEARRLRHYDPAFDNDEPPRPFSD